eukprot:TRINITY_DN3257_c0_g3_i1.p1 TRINITY_DN3257_c0_g3~~TRINITY_DN3257_c0_g3_i1.p1  ORF type:complete len:431 (+),score=93.86 TRINITY_DN3257_c0_g3_i1:85-1377(+)
MATSTFSEEDIVKEVERLKEDGVKLLSEMVSFDSLLGNEEDAQNFMAKQFASLGLEVSRVTMSKEKLEKTQGYSPVDWDVDGKEVVVGVHKPQGGVDKGKTLLFNGHMDVVPVSGSESEWTTPPFQPDVRDGWLYGRGSGDMKAGIAAYCMALRALKNIGASPASTLYLETVVEEECSGNGACAAVSSHLSEKHRIDGVIIPEPFAETIVTAQLGVMWIDVEVEGLPCHVLNTSAGSNAIESALFMFNSLRALEAKWNEDKASQPFFSQFDHPVNFNLGKIIGGNWPSSVPSKCTIQFRVGFYPDVSLDSVKEQIENALRVAGEERGVKHTVHYSGFQAEGCVFENGEMMKLLAKTQQDVAGKEAELSPVTCTTDGRFYQLYASTATCVYGPTAQRIHGVDECVSLDSLMNVTKVMALFIARWCGLEKAV